MCRYCIVDQPPNAPAIHDATQQPGQPEPAKAEQATASLGDEKWWEVFQDPELQSLIRTALKNNYDVRIAATRVLAGAGATRNHPRRSASFVERRR